MQFNKISSYCSLILTILASLFFQACQDGSRKQNTAQNTPTVLYDSLILKANQGLFYYHNQPFTGKSVSYYPNGNIATQIEFFDGKKEGLYQKYYPNNSLSFEANYKNGKQDGKIRTWWKNGVLRSESHKKNGIVEGIQKQWYASGAKFKELHYTNGQEEGIQKAWRENGKIYNNYEAKNGRIFGLKRANLCYELENEIVQFEDKE